MPPVAAAVAAAAAGFGASAGVVALTAGTAFAVGAGSFAAVMIGTPAEIHVSGPKGVQS